MTLATTVTIGGVNFTDRALESVNVTRGRAEVFGEPRAGYCNLNLIDLDGQGFDFDVLAPVTVTLTDSNATAVTLFTGIVSDWSSSLYDTGEVDGTPAAIRNVIATAPLALLNRRAAAFAGLAEQKDGDRIAALIADGLGLAWEETNGTWATQEADLSWDNYDGVDLTLIDQPGVFDLAALPAATDGYPALGQTYAAAVSGRGVVFDTADGFVAYHDADHREDDVALNGYLEVPAATFVAPTLSTQSSQADLVNRVGVTFVGGQASYTDEASVSLYGVRATRFDTILVNESNALAWALDYLEDHFAPTIVLGDAAIRLDGLTDMALLDALIRVDVSTAIEVTGLPQTLGLTRLPAFVEGITFRLDQYRTQLTLTLSDANMSIGSTRWAQVQPALTWATVDATLEWQDARSINA